MPEDWKGLTPYSNPCLSIKQVANLCWNRNRNHFPDFGPKRLVSAHRNQSPVNAHRYHRRISQKLHGIDRCIDLTARGHNGGILGATTGVEEAAESIGWDVRVIDGAGSVSGRTAAFGQALALKPDGIIINGFDRLEQAQGMKQATEAGIPLVAWHAGTEIGPMEEAGVFANVTTDPMEVSRAAASWAFVDAEGEPGVVIFTDSTYQIALDKANEMKDTIEEMGGTVLEFVDTPLAEVSQRADGVVGGPDPVVIGTHGDEVDPALDGVLRDVVVAAGHVVEFAHQPEHGIPACRLHRCDRVEGGDHRGRVRVVRVVDHDRTARQFDDLHPHPGHVGLTKCCDGGVEVDFFGERTLLPGGPATMALRTGARIVPLAVYHRGDVSHAIVRPPVPVVREGRLREDVKRITQYLAAELELLIRKQPDQWIVLQPNWPSDS